jgi:transposase
MGLVGAYSLPSHLRRVEKTIEGDETQKNCSTHGARDVIGYDTTETLVYVRPELYVLVKKYPKYACPGNPACGVASPERPTSLVEGDRYDTSVAAAVVEAKWFLHLPIYRHQDVFAGSGWMRGGMTSTSGFTSKTCSTSCWQARRTTIACCLTSGSKATQRPFASIESKSVATKPSASSSKPPAAVWPTVAASSVAPPHPDTTWCPCTLSCCR